MRPLFLTSVVLSLWAGHATSEISSPASSGRVITQERELQLVDGDLEVESYLCNSQNEEITSNAYEVGRGDPVRVCVATTRRAQLKDLYLLKFNNFRFEKLEGDRTIRQQAIESGVEAFDGDTTVDCTPGSDVCSFTTFLKEFFFEFDGDVQCIGQVLSLIHI